MNWLIIFVMFSHPGGPKTYEYNVFATEAECIAIGERAVRRNKEYFTDPMWNTYRCVDIRKMQEAK